MCTWESTHKFSIVAIRLWEVRWRCGRCPQHAVTAVGLREVRRGGRARHDEDPVAAVRLWEVRWRCWRCPKHAVTAVRLGEVRWGGRACHDEHAVTAVWLWEVRRGWRWPDHNPRRTRVIHITTQHRIRLRLEVQINNKDWVLAIAETIFFFFFFFKHTQFHGSFNKQASKTYFLSVLNSWLWKWFDSSPTDYTLCYTTEISITPEGNT